MPRQRVRLIDVAEAAGVSRATASRVLADTPRNVDHNLVDKVRQAAEELGYRPHLSARALRTGQTATVGIVVPSLANPYFVDVVESVSQQARREGQELLIADSHNDVSTEAEHLKRLADGRVDALLVVPVSYERSGTAIQRAATIMPVVQIDRCAQGSATAAVVADNEHGMSLLVDHLTSIGRTRLVYIGAQTDSSAGRERLVAFRSLMGNDCLTVVGPDFSTSAGRLAAGQLLAMGEEFDALVCGADVLAVGALSTLQRRGIAFPGDVSIVSFDNSELLELVDPPITSLQQPLDLMAKASMDFIAGVEWQGELALRLKSTLVRRESTT